MRKPDGGTCFKLHEVFLLKSTPCFYAPIFGTLRQPVVLNMSVKNMVLIESGVIYKNLTS